MISTPDKHPLLVARDGVRAAEAVFRKVVEQYLPVGSLVTWSDGCRHVGEVVDHDRPANNIKVKVGTGTYWITIDDIIRALEQ